MRFHASAKIGDTLRVIAEIESMPLAKLTVKQAVYNQDGVLCADGTVVLGFLNSNTGRIMGCPEQFRKLMEKYDR
jgi:acyl-CoA thioesterase FadM